MRVLVLVDRIHNDELFTTLSHLINLKDVELLLAFVRSPAQREGLEIIQRRPGGHRLPPRREAEVSEAEVAAGEAAMAEAEELARAGGALVETIQLVGEPGHSICDLAASRDVDLVVLRAGGRDRPPFGPASLGPVARFVTDHCAGPVLLLRSPRH
jgi:nucleotide-binding universal stress UspA family protein